ncbi:MAG: FxLYD domain-containing protein [Anaerolineae bacterium]|nr:FxLYD domain-containing protein [Anaerolineae bacterium]
MKNSLAIKLLVVVLVILSATGCSKVQPLQDTPTATEPTTDVQPTQVPDSLESETERPTATAIPTMVPATATPLPTPTLTPTAEQPVETVEDTVTPTPSPEPTEQAKPEVPAPSLPAVPRILVSHALDLVPNVDPGPPIDIEVQSNDLLEGFLHRISGVIRNESDNTYTGLSVIATFFINTGNRYGPINVNVKCLMLAPGATCPFIVHATSKNLTGVILHVTGYDTPRTPLTPEYWGIRYYVDSIGYVHITGTVHNPYTIPAQHVTVVGSLVNSQGNIVNVGSTILLDPLEAGANETFEIIVKYMPFQTVGIVTQAEP